MQLAEKEAQLTEAVELLATYESKLEECEKKYKELEVRAQSEQLDLEIRSACKPVLRCANTGSTLKII